MFYFRGLEFRLYLTSCSSHGEYDTRHLPILPLVSIQVDEQLLLKFMDISPQYYRICSHHHPHEAVL
jgi:hypothetical protein